AAGSRCGDGTAAVGCLWLATRSLPQRRRTADLQWDRAGDGAERETEVGAFPLGLFPKFLRQSFHEWAGHSIAQSVWARAYYQQQRDRGSDHHAAVRALAFKWIRILFRCWKDRVAYDENKYLAALAKRGSPLGKLVVVGMASL